MATPVAAPRMPAPAEEVFGRRARILYWTIAVILGIFIGRLYLLQVIRGAQYQTDALANSVKARRIEAPRGLILDRRGRVLVANRKSYDLVLDRELMKDANSVAEWVAGVTGEDIPSILARISGSGQPSFKPITLARDLAFSQVAFVEARREDVPELSIETTILRQYPSGAFAAHVLGYVGEIDEKELSKEELAHHRPGDIVGKAGIERSYDGLLSGHPGVRRTVVNNVGREISTSVAVTPVPGSDIKLALDLDVQRAAEEGLAAFRGAAIMLDVKTGGVLAIASAPTYDPNAFVGGISPVRWKELNSDPRHPLRNRALAGIYPPGSVWKALVSAAAIQSGKHQRGFSVSCSGTMFIGGRLRHCWKEEGHGTVNMHEAMVHSCNVYYYTAGRDIGATPMQLLGKDVGFGEFSGIDLPGESSGVLPTDAWKRKTTKQGWYPGDTINMAIGQGFLAVTPMQVAMFAMSIASSGDVNKPHVFDEAMAPGSGQVIARFKPVVVSHVPYTEVTLDFLRDAMEDVVSRGTATRARLPGIRIAGKTGTAQPSSGEAPKGVPRSQRAERYQEHAWFMGFAPVEDPEIAFAIVLEHAGLHGGEGAAPIAHDMLAAYFVDRLQASGQ